MEDVPKQETNRPNLELVYDRDVVEKEAQAEAEKLFYERGLDEMSGFEQASSLINLMEELAEQGNENRHIVEALAQMTKIVEEDNQSHVTKTTHPKAAAALGRAVA